MNPPLPLHGGGLSEATSRFGAPLAGWLDLSTGINPTAYPHIAVSPDAWARLPDAGALGDLLDAARAAYGVPARAGLCAAPGTQAILQVLPDVIGGGGDVAVVSPTYSEHGHIWRSAGRNVVEVSGLGAIGDAAVVVIVNPNNPDGARVAPDELAAVHQRLAAQGGLLVIDEAFADVTPEISMVSRAGADGLLILRSFGKFFGLAGLRLGFATGPERLIEALSARLGPWAVSGAAIEIGARALADADWIAAMRQNLAGLREQLDLVLTRAGMEIIGGTDLFRLVAVDDAAALHEQLGKVGILVRKFADHPTWLRFGLPGDDEGLKRLARALSPPGR
jgi:cobalamin biosynthetic protein CobC